MRRTTTWGAVLGGVLLAGGVVGLRAGGGTWPARGLTPGPAVGPRPTVTVYKTPT